MGPGVATGAKRGPGSGRQNRDDFKIKSCSPRRLQNSSRQNSGLNREILSQGWYGMRTKLEYRSARQGHTSMAIPAPHTKPDPREPGPAGPENLPVHSLWPHRGHGSQRSGEHPAPGYCGPLGRASGGFQATRLARVSQQAKPSPTPGLVAGTALNTGTQVQSLA